MNICMYIYIYIYIYVLLLNHKEIRTFNWNGKDKGVRRMK